MSRQKKPTWTCGMCTFVNPGRQRTRCKAIGQLFLSGRVLWKGKTNGRLLTLNGRRSA